MPVTFVAHYLSISRTGSHCRGAILTVSWLESSGWRSPM